MTGSVRRHLGETRGLAGPRARKSVSLALQGGGAHGAFTWGVLDALLEDGRLAEHWDVVEDEATRETSVSGLPMFGATFPESRG